VNASSSADVLQAVREHGSALDALHAGGGGIACDPCQLRDLIAWLIAGRTAGDAVTEGIALGYLLGRREAPELPSL
jgi:hypothetical protein